MSKINKKSESNMDLVVKSNRLNMAIQNLSLSEIRLIQLAIIDSRESGEGLDATKPLSIHASRYAKAFDVSNQTAYEVLLSAEENLFERRFSFIDEDDDTVKSRWISQAKYCKGSAVIQIMFTPAVVTEISRIDGAVQFFTRYNLEQTAQLNSLYSVRLYELLAQWKHLKKTGLFKLETFRGQLGLGVNEYKQMSDFKRRVLDAAVKEINEKTDIKVSYTQEKKGVSVIGFKFIVLSETKPRKQVDRRDKDTLDMFDGMTDQEKLLFKPMTTGQLALYSSLLAKDPDFNSKALPANIGEQPDDYKFRIQRAISKYNTQIEWLPYLLKNGFKPSY